MSRRLRQPQRACAAILAALWLALPLLALLHSSTHAHRFCPEHQALEELSREESAAPSQSARSGGERDDVEALSRGAEGEGPHERCLLAWIAPRQAGAPGARELVRTDEPRGPLGLREWHGLEPSVPLLALAPKSSPPVR
ncbi:hypothetical protein [Hyalangium gracile]|uniref:hypothetical protein n=1 Tax=Hyalangium gracile TaxID=394092 RepID=UPI001CCA2864|nr:hypothetical protein [Hyalangium gracile]